VIRGSIVLRAANIHAVTRARRLGSEGINASDRSATCSTMAPDSNSTKSSSSYAGTCPNG